jgi:hypothetical protein
MRGDVRGAESEYLRASEADRWHPHAPGRIAELRIDEWRQLDRRDRDYASWTNGPFADAIEALQVAQHRDPQSIAWPRRRAECWMALFGRTSDLDHAARALELLRGIVPRYETNAALWTELSDAAAAAGSPGTARDAAHRALSLDDLNRRLGHVERVLPADTRQRLDRRIEGPK